MADNNRQSTKSGRWDDIGIQLVLDNQQLSYKGHDLTWERYVIIVTHRFPFLNYDRYRFRGKSHPVIRRCNNPMVL